MAKEKVELLVKGGEATPAPPIGPSLSPLGVNVGLVVKEINNMTSSLKGMEVPVKIVVDTETKKFSIEIGKPPVTAMIKKELKTEKLATVGEDKIRKSPGSVSFESVVNIARGKDTMYGDIKARVKQILGTCLSGGVLVENRNPREIIKEIDEGKIKIES